MTTMNIKKGDTVLVTAGKEKGKKGPIEKIIALTNRVVVQGINMRKHHLKPTQSSPRGGIVEIPGTMNRANVMIICPHCNKPTRVKHTITENGSKFRSCIHCNGSLDSAQS